MRTSTIDIKPIGIVHVNLSDEDVKKAWFKGGVRGVIEVYPEYENGLHGIDGFSHILIVAWLHKVKPSDRRVLIVKPRRLVKLGFSLEELPLMGVFTCDSPARPNPIGLTIARLLKRRGRMLYVDGIDLFDGTPVLDIRAITPEMIPEGIEYPGWYKEFRRKVRERVGDVPI